MLRPQDVLVVLKVHLLAGPRWALADVATPLGLSASEVHGALRRLDSARLYSAERRATRPRNIAEFLVHGLKYWLPVQLGTLARGVPTAASGPPLCDLLSLSGPEAVSACVWPHPDGKATGLAIVPFYPTVPGAALGDPALHALLALVEALRLGGSREQEVATQELGRRLGAT